MSNELVRMKALLTGESALQASEPNSSGLAIVAGDKPQFWSSLNPAVHAERELLFRCSAGADENASDFPDMIVDLEHVYAEQVDKEVADGGEVVTLTRLCLIDPEGKIVQTFSTGIKKSLSFLFHFFGPPPYKPSIKVQLKRVKTNKGFYMFQLSPVQQNGSNRKPSH